MSQRHVATEVDIRIHRNTISPLEDDAGTYHQRRDGRRYFLPEAMAAIDAVPIEEVGQPLLLAS